MATVECDAALVADSTVSPDLTAVFSMSSGMTAGAVSGAAAWMLFGVHASPSAGSGLAGSVLEGESLTSSMVATSGFSCPGFDKIHHTRPSTNPVGRVALPVPRIVSPAPLTPTYSVGTGTGRAGVGPAVQTPIRRR